MANDLISNRTKHGVFYELPKKGRGYDLVRPPSRHWCTETLFNFILDLSETWAIVHPLHRLAIGDLAEKDGRDMSDHSSHFSGMGIDIYVFSNPYNSLLAGPNSMTWNVPNTTTVRTLEQGYDQARTMKLVEYILSMRLRYPIQEVLYNDPDVLKNYAGTKLRKHRNHEDHVHVLLNGRHPHGSAYSMKRIGLAQRGDVPKQPIGTTAMANKEALI